METVVRWTPFSDDTSNATMEAEKAILCVLLEEFSEPDEIDINTCLILQNTLDVTVTALAFQNKREHPNRVKGFVETVVPNYCDPTFTSHFRMKRQTFQVKHYPLLTSETVIWSIWPYYFYFEYIYIYAFSRRFYPKRLTVHSGYTFVLSLHVFPGNRTHNAML